MSSFLKRCFTGVVFGPVLAAALMLGALPLLVDNRGQGNLTALKGHLATLQIVSQHDPRDTYFNFTVDEYPQIFHVTRMEIVDQQLLAIEREHDVLEFTVDRVPFEAGNVAKLDVHSLKTREHSLYDERAAALTLSRDWGAGLAIEIGMLLYGLWWVRRLAPRYRAAREGTLEGPFDPLLAWLANGPLKGLAGRFAWVAEAAEAQAAVEAKIAQGHVNTGRAPNYARAIELLLKRGGDVNVHDEHGKTPLHVATLGGHVEAVGILLADGAKPDLPDQDGNTALMLAIQGGFVGVAKKLIEAGADPLALNKTGAKAIDLAREAKNAAILQMCETAVLKAAKKAAPTS